MRPAALLGTLAVLLPVFSPAARLYYTDQPAGDGTVRSTNLDGTGAAVVVTYPAGANLRGIGWHRGSGRVFVLDEGAKVIRSLLPDGTGEQTITTISAAHLGSDLEIDESTGHIFWAETSGNTGVNGFIRTCPPDGGVVGNAVTTPGGVDQAPYFIHVDRPGGFLYWGVTENAASSNGSTTFRRATFQGALDTAFAIVTPTRSRDIVVDHATATAIWADRQTGTIYRRALAGGSSEVVISSLNAPHGLAFDAVARKLYWADTGQRGSGSGLSARKVARCNVDGSGYEDLSVNTGGNQPWDLALDLSSPTFATWLTRFFPAGSALRGPLDDPDGDGITSLLEYAFDLNPALAERPGATASANPEPRVNGIRYLRRRVASVEYRVEVSTDLVNWHFNGDGSGQTWSIDGEVETMDAEMDRVTVSAGPAVPQSERVFFRIRITQTPP
jgi:hypothetical protein